MDFFEKFKQAEYEFTYGALDDPENYNALQVGLVAYFYIDKGYLQTNRDAIASALELCHGKIGKKLKWSFFKNPNVTEKYTDSVASKYKMLIENSGGEHVDFWCASEEGFEHSSDYRIHMASSADWFEIVHSAVSFFNVNFPASYTNSKEGISALLNELCVILKPMHGLLGLGIQQCQEKETFQHIEYDICHDFLGIDVTNDNTDEHFRNGIRSINWYTFFNEHWLGKLGGINTLRSKLDDPRIQITSYDGG
ncbi:type VI immunity family protein, partial [Rahnella contaminans]|uniref:type VI immunity family protein n=1 Tax=Rahnella contaminans TaxID=2703882 RepID=UPI0023DAE8A7